MTPINHALRFTARFHFRLPEQRYFYFARSRCLVNGRPRVKLPVVVLDYFYWHLRESWPNRQPNSATLRRRPAAVKPGQGVNYPFVVGA